MSHPSNRATSPLYAFSTAQQGARICIINIMDNASGTKRHFEKTIKAADPNAKITWCRMQCAKKDPKYFREQDFLLSDTFVDWQDQIGLKDFDLVILTGIDRGNLSYADLQKDFPDFWEESCDLIRTIQHSVSIGKTGHAALVCWAAFAYMKEMYAIEKGIHDEKFYGIFSHIVNTNHPLCLGFEEQEIAAPQSRYSYMDADELKNVIYAHGGEVAMNGPDGPAIWTLENGRITCFINHLEYSPSTLHNEYKYGQSKYGEGFLPPQNYSYDPQNPDPYGIFECLSTSCSKFYKNLIALAQLQKSSSYNTNPAIDVQIGYRKWAFGS